MLVVGLTGGISTGKSTVSRQLKSFGIPVIDADVIARQVVEPGTSTLKAIVREFGEDILSPDGTLDRPKLGSIVFHDEMKRKKLNGIVHPAVWRAMFYEILRNWFSGKKMCVMDVPLLVEGGMWKWMGKVVVVYCSPELQLQRLMLRDKSDREAASARLNSQLPIADKLRYADIVVDNSGSPQDLEEQVDQLVRRLYKDVGWSWRISWLLPPFAVLSAAWILFWRHIKRLRAAKSRRHNKG